MMTGYVPAVVHAARGNSSQAKRAFGRSTNAAVNFAIALGVGTAVVATAGTLAPVAALIGGTALGGATGALAGNVAQVAVEKTTFTDKDKEIVGQEASDKTFAQWAGDVLLGSIAGAAGGAVHGKAAALAQRAASGVMSGAHAIALTPGQQALQSLASPTVGDAIVKQVHLV